MSGIFAFIQLEKMKSPHIQPSHITSTLQCQLEIFHFAEIVFAASFRSFWFVFIHFLAV